jgi:ferredoxin
VPVRIADSGAVLKAQPGETLLETLERSGYQPDFSCRAGACGTCRLRLVSGTVGGAESRSNPLTDEEKSQGYVLSCVAVPQTEIVLASAGASARATRTGGRVADRSRWRHRLRASLVAAAVVIFGTSWGLTSHRVATQTTATHTSSPVISTTTKSPTTSGSSSSSTASGSSYSTSSNSGSATSSSVNTSTGVS